METKNDTDFKKHVNGLKSYHDIMANIKQMFHHSLGAGIVSYPVSTAYRKSVGPL